MKAGIGRRTWKWPHQLKRPRTGWIAYTIWAIKMSVWCAGIRDGGGLRSAADVWRWLNPFTVKVK